MVLALVAGWEPYDLHDLASVSEGRSASKIYRSCTTYQRQIRDLL